MRDARCVLCAVFVYFVDNKYFNTTNLIANEKIYFFYVDAALCSDNIVGAKFTLCERWIAWKCD